jgi:quinol monooxygenase YgiN
MSSQDSDSPPVEEQVTSEDVVDLFDELELPLRDEQNGCSRVQLYRSDRSK